MSSSSAISGLNAAANSISVVSNNIANANTTGFKQSVAQFADVYTNNFQGANANTGGTTQPGSGVAVIQDTQQFSQGAAQTTGNNLDMVVNGNGFFTLAPNPGAPTAVVYSRAGAFNVNKVGMVTNTLGQALMVYKPNNANSASAGFSTGAMSTISVPHGSGLPSATNAISLAANLNAGSPSPAVTPFDPVNSDSYTSQTSTTIYDSLGGAHNLTTYYVALGADPNTANQTVWAAYNYMTDNPLAPQILTSNNGSSGVTSGGIPQNNPSLYSASLVNNTSSAYTALSNAVTGGIGISPVDIAANYTKIASDMAIAQNSPATYLVGLNDTAVTQANIAVDATGAAKASGTLTYNNFTTLLTGAANLKAFATAQNAAAIAFPGAAAAVTMLTPSDPLDLTTTPLADLAKAVKDTATSASLAANINAADVLAVKTAAQQEITGLGTTAARLTATAAAVTSAAIAATDATAAHNAVAAYNAALQVVSSYLPGGMAAGLSMGYSAPNAAASAIQANNAKDFAVAAALTATKVLSSTTTPSTLVAAAELANSTAQTAATSATAYAAAASLVSNIDTAKLASTAAAMAQTDADTAQKAATAYNTALLVAAPGFIYDAGSLLSFNAVGQLNSPPISTLTWAPPIGAPISTTMDYSNTTQISSAFNVIASTQNGLVAGTLTGITVNSSGVISANYSNSSSIALGQVALANFNNPQGLSQIGGSNWGQSAASGTAISGSPGNGEFGTIQSGAIEQSNVNLSEQLVALITAQQAYQANSQSISAQNKMVETILNAAR